MNISRLKWSLVLITVVVCSLFVIGCKSSEDNGVISDSNMPYMEYLGDYNYTETPIAMVYEQVEDEEEGFYGIQYRKVEDLGGLSTQSDIAVCLFFYSSLNNSAASMTAGVEDLAQTLTGQVLFVAIDAAVNFDIGEAYGVQNYPEFILINDAARIATFDSSSHEYWTINDVAQWISDNGFTPDYSRLQ